MGEVKEVVEIKEVKAVCFMAKYSTKKGCVFGNNPFDTAFRFCM